MATIEIEDFYPYPHVKRYGGTIAAHNGLKQILEANVAQYLSLLKDFSEHIPLLQTLPFEQETDTGPYWDNGFLPFLDIISIVGFLGKYRPRLYIEVGSGNSTKTTAFARKHLGLSETRIISIDPHPRAEVDGLCDEVIRKPLQDCDLSLFDSLDEGDILFFDGSHRTLQNSDNQVLFFEIIPKLKPGVIIHLHDIMWPHDYPDEWSNRYYNEQYVLGAMLLYAPKAFNVLFPAGYVSFYTDYQDLYKPVWNRAGFEQVERYGCSFWMTKTN